ncbi:hypothetical protein LAZ67_13002377 [Cordylochernes scorpioides]|uniref:Uncharacterized protein n=1 Tax=Cordylochernes scorpioides TaxID=51811 RepID=A0ABY6L715_9ARAC|nr:hypothetical protein LAZ67_13002377 [Cordylochernes scorpioides]
MGEELKEIKEKIEKLYDELFSLDEVDIDKESEAYDGSMNKIGSLRVSKIFSLRAIKNPSAKCLHEFMDVCNEAIRNLETLELKRNQLVDVILVHFLQQKLSENLRCYYMPHHPEDADYQRILWRPSPEEPVVDYRLLTRQTAVKEVEDLEGLPVYHRAILKENGEWPEVTKAIQSLDLVFILGPADKEHETAEKYLSFFKTRRCELPKFGLLPESTYDLLRSWLRFPSNLNQGSAAGGSMTEECGDLRVKRIEGCGDLRLKKAMIIMAMIIMMEFISRVQADIDEDPGKSMRALARELRVYEGTIRRVVHEDLRYKSYSQAPSEQLKHAEEPGMIWFFSDEKSFAQDQKVPESMPSPDVNPLDYYVWGVVERDSNSHSHNTVAALRDAIVDAMANILKTHLITACRPVAVHVPSCTPKPEAAADSTAVLKPRLPSKNRSSRRKKYNSKVLEIKFQDSEGILRRTMAATLQKIDLDPEQQLYTPKIVDIAAAVMEMHGDI